MGAIERLERKFTVQKCVFWGNPENDGKGGFTFDAPVEIDCRWEDKQELMEQYDGNKFSSQAKVLVNIDIPRRSYLHNSTLAALQTIATAKGYDINNPVSFPDVFIVVQFEKIPMVRKTNDFLRIAYLYNQG